MDENAQSIRCIVSRCLLIFRCENLGMNRGAVAPLGLSSLLSLDLAPVCPNSADDVVCQVSVPTNSRSMLGAGERTEALRQGYNLPLSDNDDDRSNVLRDSLKYLSSAMQTLLQKQGLLPRSGVFCV